MSDIRHETQIAHDRHLIAAIEKHFGKADVFVIKGTTYKPSDIVSLLQGHIDSALPVPPAKAAWMACVAEEEKVRTAMKPIVQAFLTLVLVHHGDSPELLADFGITPKKRRALTAAEKATAADRARATRKANGKKPKEEPALPAAPPPAPPK